MQTVWVVGDADDIIKIPPNLSKEYFTYGGSVYGNATHPPRVYEYFDEGNKCRSVGYGATGDRTRDS
jgi:hypothetical protein